METEKKEEISRGYTLKIDYKNDRLFLANGEPVRLYGYDALKERITKLIFTQKDKFLIYKLADGKFERYGNPVLKYIGQNLPHDFLEAEAEWWVKDIFYAEDEILEINNISAIMIGDNLKVEYKLKTIYGVKEDNINV
ncbi:MAG: DUF2634 domain-containing protein [Cetobacterium sp.]